MIQRIAFILVAIVAVATAQFNYYGNGGIYGNRRGIGGNRGGRPGIGVGGGNGQVGDLSFLANITDPTVRAKFQAIYFNHTLNETTRAAAVVTLISTLDASVQAAYANWKAAQAQKVADKEALLAAQIANVTALVDKLRDGVYAIKNNASLTNEEKILLLPSEFEKLFKSIQQTMNDLYYVGGAPRPENVGGSGGGGDYPNYPDYPGNFPDYGTFGGPGRPRGGPRGGGSGPVWPPRGRPGGSPFGIGGPNNRPGPGGFPGGFGGFGGRRPNPFGGF